MIDRKSRTIFIGDVHGCYYELQQMLKQLKYSQKDRVIFLGDIINRGPAPLSVVRHIAQRGHECVLGNHENHYLLYSTSYAPYIHFRKQLGPDLHNWLENLPPYIESENFIAVHAGLQPNKKLAESDLNIILNIRTWDGEGINLSNYSNPPWYEFYHKKRPVFYGHWAKKGLNLRGNTFGLDSACVYGGALSAYVLETHQLIQVKAKKCYYP